MTFFFIHIRLIQYFVKTQACIATRCGLPIVVIKRIWWWWWCAQYRPTI